MRNPNNLGPVEQAVYDAFTAEVPQTVAELIKEARQRAPGTPSNNVRRAFRSLVKRGYLAEVQGYVHGGETRPGHVYATSTLYRAPNENGKVVLQWVKKKHEEATRQENIEIVRDAFKSLTPLPEVKGPEPGSNPVELLNVIPMGDPHFGMFAWAAETGDDYDLQIAEALHVRAMERLLMTAADARECLIVNVGDYFHGNDSKNRTPQSGHALDVDTRYQKVVRAGLRSLERQITLALEKHEVVHLISVPGNHDPEASIIITECFKALFRNNSRVCINDTPSKFAYHEFGKVLIGVTHGDTVKLEKLGELMSCDQREAWGRTEHHHWITGHVHHARFHEGVGFTAESLRTLAGRDAYAAAYGYRSRRDMQLITFDANFGEIERHRVDTGELLPAKAA